jgi:thioredoxin-related protein
MIKKFFWACLLSPFFAAAQAGGISFRQELTWPQLLEKAKTEHKYVFVDCYTSGCDFCKSMDLKIYGNDTVGAYMNDKFISIRMQMDSTKNDDPGLRRGYSTAHELIDTYHVVLYPTYLFFSPKGQVAHKDGGLKNIEEFLAMVRAATDSQQQYYTLLSNYRHGSANYQQMGFLANCALRSGQDSLSSQIATKYIRQYLEVLPEGQLWTKENVLFVATFYTVISAGDKIFHSFYKNRVIIDSFANIPDLWENTVDDILYRDVVCPAVNKALAIGSTPNWRQIKKEIETEFDRFHMERNVLKAQVEYYKKKKEWSQYVNYLIRQQELEGIDTWEIGRIHSVELNNYAYEVFQHSSDHAQLRKALAWVDRALSMLKKPDAREMDTKANILYRLGYKRKGLLLEEQSHALSPKNDDITASYEKMKSGSPTWPTN